MRQVTALMALALVLASPAGPAPAGADAAPSKLEDLAWIAGSWGGDDGRIQMEEHWTAPRGGAMLGLHRDVAAGRMVSFEFLRIVETAEGIAYLSMPQGRPVTAFPLLVVEGKRVVFENPAHDFPQRIIYWLEADGSLAARIEGTQDGKESSAEWRWKPSSLK